MGLRIQTNVASIFGQRQLRLATDKYNKHTQRLSSGYRINMAADDAAGLAISAKMGAQVRSLTQARRNASDGISLVQTAEGGLNEISNIVSRLRELAVQSASDTIGPTERGHLNKEFMALKDEVDRIALAAEFNGTRLLTGPAEIPEVLRASHNPSPLEIQVGSDYNPSVDGLEVPNPVNIIRVDLSEMNAMTDGPSSLDIGGARNPEGVRVDSKQAAQLSIERLDKAIEKVNSYRAYLGAVQNRLVSTISNVSIGIENLQAAASRIKDADYAEEAAAMTQAGILQRSSVSVLAQANQWPELALKLLQ